MSNISELRREIFSSAIRGALLGVASLEIKTYLLALVEKDLDGAEETPREHLPWASDCTCGAADAEDCRCEACALWREEFNGGKPAAPVDDAQRPWVCEWQDCEESTGQGSVFCEHHHEMMKSYLEQFDRPAAPQPIVEVELVAKPPQECDCGLCVPEVADTPPRRQERARCAAGR